MNKVVQKDKSVRIGFKNWFWWSIFLKSVQDFPKTCISALGQMHLFQKFTYSPIFLYRLAWRNGSIGIWKAAHFTAALRRNLRTSSPPFTAPRWRIFWTTTPCFCTGAAETSSADTGRQKAGTVSNLPTTQRSAGQASAAGKPDKRPSVRSAFAIWWKNLVPIFHLCFACEVW